MKDYYNILNIPTTATADEVKKAFRKLALLYHPDKHPDTRFANAKFTELKEAYQVLGDRKKRAEYNYSRYFQSAGSVYQPLAACADDILQSSIELRNKIAGMDPFRIDRDQLFYEASRILSDHNINLLTKAAFSDTHTKIVHILTDSFHHLPFDYVKELIKKLQKIHTEESSIQNDLKEFLVHARVQHYWNRYQFLIALIAAVLVCVFIYTSGR